MAGWKLGTALVALTFGACLAAACGGSNGGGGGGATGGPADGGTTTSPGSSSGSGVGSSSGSPIFGGSSSGASSGSSSGSPGTTTCDPTCAAAGGTCSGTSCTISENPGGVSSGDQGSLNGGGSADSAFAWLYPYDGTVFPRGLLPLTLQFGGTAFDAAEVKVTFPGMTYTGFYGPGAAPSQIKFSAAVWSAITAAAQATSAVKVEVTKESSGQVSGPITETWTIAQGNIRGTIYYETYGSQLIDAGTGGLGGLGGGDDSESVGIMKIQPGATAPTVLKSGCGNVCHTASADGATLVANAGDETSYSSSSASYNLKSNAATIYAAANLDFTYGGIYPDGTFVMSATNYRTWTGGGLLGILGGSNGNSLLYNTSTGANIPVTGWTVQNAGTPAFSPDGTMMAYNSGLDNNGTGGSLGVASFDNATKTFSNLATIANAPDSTNVTLAWPAFTPDTKNVLYHAGSNGQFETDQGATGDLYVVDIATHTATRLDSADGYSAAAPSTSTYLPASDPDLSFAPTVLPEAVGGYFWAVFTSHRSYGNLAPSKDNNDQNGKLWVTAIDINTTPGKDPSHPAFFLDGQELTSDNLRGFWVLNPCAANGASCASGDDCCGGFCRANDDGGALQCFSSAPTGGCSQQYEKCTTAADCCNTNDQCINGFCATPAPK